MALDFNQVSGALATVQAESVPGTMPVRVKNVSNTPIAAGAVVEIVLIRKINGDETVAPEVATEPSFVQIEIANS